MEKEYKLLNCSNEVIKKVRTKSRTLAINFFCEIKKLKPRELFKIFKVSDGKK
jgi:hypothetical protein